MAYNTLHMVVLKSTIFEQVKAYIRSPRPEGFPRLEGFNNLALQVFGFQYTNNPVYRTFCKGRGRTPDKVETWKDIPVVPTGAIDWRILQFMRGFILHVDRFRREFLGEFINHHHGDCLGLGHVVANPHTLHTALAAVYRNKGGITGLIILNGVGLRTVLGAEGAFFCTADFRIDLRNKIHESPM